ncbi:hypothetical protein LNQ49_18420 [Flavobacterium sp. F-65]|uniref:NB-ARC domain-containing protein n=1 Tax=Flavobacterium pisciphilum TaxID=2893755 RepID=A0ABS8MZG1_9FLAO|nr:NB-ARC domain-containing protein [Flavobacterium sp. F-65]MCC9073556.1 hypothetical protein [Flavobacterium sp. F-65]
MKPELLKLIKKNQDAYYVNRGFYYQYLTVLQKWIQHYISSDDITVFTEVGNDIKEVGQKLVYTQVKCYKAPFSFQNSILKKELFSFFVQYLEEKEINLELEFHFFTNSALTKNETLLAAWMNSQPLTEGELLNQCRKKIREIFKKELKEICAKKLYDKRKTEKEKLEIKSGFAVLIAELDISALLDDFISRIHWSFGKETPLESITTIHNTVLEDLKHQKFEGKPPQMLLEALLSEIYRCSQLEDSENRKVDNKMMEVILARKDDEISNFTNESLVKLLDVRFYALEEKVALVEHTVELHGKILKEHSTHLNSLLAIVAKPKDVLLPRDFTLIPYINNTDGLGRTDDLLNLYNLLLQNKCVSLCGVGGIGKTVVAKLYANNYRNEYDHVLWLDTETGIYESFILNEGLIRNLSVNPEETPHNKFLDIIQKLNNIQGKGLLVINDLLNDENEKLDKLKSLYNWHVIFTSRLRVNYGIQQEVKPLSFEHASQLYRKFEPDRIADDNIFEQFFDLIEYNTLTIVLVAKTIHLSFDLTLEKFLIYLREQRLDDEDIEVDIELGSTSVNLLNILQKTFNISTLSSYDRYYMEFLALLPAEGITMADLLLLYGKESEKKNKAELTKVVNQLHKKGLITRTGSQIKMDMIFQESVLYQLRKDKNTFMSQMFHIPFLTARIREGVDGNPGQAARFIKYAQSFVSKITEEYRASIYQPMLILENEMLNVLNWFQNSKDLIQKWENLTLRAIAYMDAGDLQLGIIFHNYGLNLAAINKREEASKYFDMSIVIFKSGQGNASHLLNMLCNKAHLYLQLNDLESFKITFQEISDLRELYNLWHDHTFPLQCHLLGTANKNNDNFVEAKKMFSIAVNAQRELPIENRNDLNLVIYLCDLAFCFLMDKEIEPAERAVIYAVNILYPLKMGPGKHLERVIEILIWITDLKGELETSSKLKERLENLFRV